MDQCYTPCFPCAYLYFYMAVVVMDRREPMEKGKKTDLESNNQFGASDSIMSTCLWSPSPGATNLGQ
jgi:hypothetical protein